MRHLLFGFLVTFDILGRFIQLLLVLSKLRKAQVQPLCEEDVKDIND